MPACRTRSSPAALRLPEGKSEGADGTHVVQESVKCKAHVVLISACIYFWPFAEIPFSQVYAVGDEHHFIFHCPALTPLRERYPQLLVSLSRSLRQFIWQQDQVAVVNFVFDAFQARLVFQGR